MPVLGPLDVTTTEIAEAALNALRLAALGLAFAAYALLLDHDRLVVGRARCPALGARGRAGDPTRAVARARRGGARGVGAGAGCPARRGARLRDPALAARRRLARARDESGGGDGGAWLRPSRRDEARRVRPGAGATGSRSWRRSCSWRWRRCGFSVGRRPLLRVSGRRARARGRLAGARAGRGRGTARPLGLREVDAAPRARRARTALPRRPLHRPGRRHRPRYALRAAGSSSPEPSRASSRIRRTRS